MMSVPLSYLLGCVGVWGGLLLGALPAHAQPHAMDPLFVVGAKREGADFKVWRVNNESGVALVAADSGVTNHHPVSLSASNLKRILNAIQWENNKGQWIGLLRAEEVDALLPVLSRAWVEVKANQDVLVLSTARREGGLLSVPTSVSMRMFVQDEQLQVLVGEARSHALDMFRSVKTLPAFDFGLRKSGAKLKISADGARSVRSDWLSFVLQPSADASATVKLPITQEKSVSAPLPQPATATLTPDLEEKANRLRGLRQMMQEGLITEAEYQVKRKSIVDAL